MAADNNDNEIDGDGATGNDDGDGVMGEDNKDDDNCNDDGNDDNNYNGDGTMGSGATVYVDDDTLNADRASARAKFTRRMAWSSLSSSSNNTKHNYF